MASHPSSALSARSAPAARRPGAIAWLASHAHFAMVGLVMGTVALMVLPIPAAVLDVLIALNITASVLLLMLALYIPHSLGMSTFPSLIVLTTVLRLSLNIASTKQILLHAHAGHIIETFGRLVMGGQVAVGIVVFSIIAIVQFIVISKGAERIAEVGARFTLDAIPGRQMSIEADLKGGLIDKQEAKRLRQRLEQESHMHGSMDGAMKFVKGDAIAAIIIALVNIIAGMYVGAAVQGMALGDAVARYTLLSVGDGMVSQIPSLLTSVAAGVLTTRVAGVDSDPKHLAGQIGRQIAAQPMALLAAGSVALVFVLVPGFPKAPFLVLGLCLLGGGWLALKRSRTRPSFERDGGIAVGAHRRTDLAPGLEPGTAGAAAGSPARQDDIVVPLTLRLSPALKHRISPAALQHQLETERDLLQRELGLGFPALVVRFDPDLPEQAYAIDVQEVRSPALSLPAQTADSTPAETGLARAVTQVIRLRPDAFVGTQEINTLLKRVQAHLPDLSEEISRAMPMQKVAEVLRRLALEGVSLRYMREIYESLLVWSPREKDASQLCEYVRMDLGRFICHGLVDEQHRLCAMMLEPGFERLVKDAIKPGPGGATYLALSPEVTREFNQDVLNQLKTWPNERAPALVTSMEVRRFVRRMLVAQAPQVHVLSVSEIPPEVVIEPQGLLRAARAGSASALPSHPTSQAEATTT